MSLYILSGFAHAGQDDLTSQFLSLPVKGDTDRVWFNKGKILYEQMDYLKSRNAFSKISNNAPPDILAESLYLSANCLLKTGNYDTAASLADDVSSKSWVYPFALYTRAMISLNKGNNMEALKLLEEVSKHTGSVLSFLRKQTAEEEARQRQTLALAHRASLTLGFMHLEKKEYNEAIKYLLEIPKESQYYANALFGLGWAYAGMDRLVRSVVIWETLFSSYPNSRYSLEVAPYIGNAYTQLNAYGKAVEQNGIALRYYKDVSAKISALIIEIQQGDIKKISTIINVYGNNEVSAGLRLYKGLLQMEEYLGQSGPDTHPDSESLIRNSIKKRQLILDDIKSAEVAHLEKLQKQLLETSIETTIRMAQNLMLEGGGQISSNMTFIDHD
ncbi:MAG: tetratricopeptide repeat protein [Nitrospirae bacterium]|nr:tetratricopeptide repeat protein [Nitrospirota bacterium]